VIADSLRKAIARVPLLRRMVKSGPGQYLVQTARAATVVREPVRFAVRQLGPSGVGGYRLRGSGLRIFVRHEGVLSASEVSAGPTGDVHILNEIFGGTGGQYAYDPPPALAAALDARPPLKVMDLGGNIGLFGAYVLGRWPGAAIHSFEPDPANLRLLERLVAANQVGDHWSVTGVAVANYDGEMSFVAGLHADSHLATGDSATEPGTVTVPTMDFFEQDHEVDLMKMDIEGGEWSILTDPRFAGLRAAVVVLEWHAQGCPEPDPHEAAARLLRSAGYSRVEDVEVGTYNGVMWAWRDEQAAT
jgi:FkbM family methyltransferase